MAQDLNETPTFEATVPSLITTDAVKGSVQGSDPNVGEANGPHINLANRTQHLNDNKLSKSGGTMTGALDIENANVRVKVGGNTFFEAENTGRMKQAFGASAVVHRYTGGEKSFVLPASGQISLGATVLTSGELFMVRAVMRDQADSSTNYIAFGMVDTGVRASIKFEAVTGLNPQHANQGNGTVAGFEIGISGGEITVFNHEAAKTVDIIYDVIGMP